MPDAHIISTVNQLLGIERGLFTLHRVGTWYMRDGNFLYEIQLRCTERDIKIRDEK